MDTRIGYPNEHLGKSKVDAVKSPMYATSVGLVLAGYQSLDQRGAEKIIEVPERKEYQKPTQKSGGKEGGGLINMIKGLLSDDIDNNKQSY